MIELYKRFEKEREKETFIMHWNDIYTFLMKSIDAYFKSYYMSSHDSFFRLSLIIPFVISPALVVCSMFGHCVLKIDIGVDVYKSDVSLDDARLGYVFLKVI